MNGYEMNYYPVLNENTRLSMMEKSPRNVTARALSQRVRRFTPQHDWDTNHRSLTPRIVLESQSINAIDYEKQLSEEHDSYSPVKISNEESNKGIKQYSNFKNMRFKNYFNKLQGAKSSEKKDHFPSVIKRTDIEKTGTAEQNSKHGTMGQLSYKSQRVEIPTSCSTVQTQHQTDVFSTYTTEMPASNEENLGMNTVSLSTINNTETKCDDKTLEVYSESEYVRNLGKTFTQCESVSHYSTQLGQNVRIICTPEKCMSETNKSCSGVETPWHQIPSLDSKPVGADLSQSEGKSSPVETGGQYSSTEELETDPCVSVTQIEGKSTIYEPLKTGDSFPILHNGIINSAQAVRPADQMTPVLGGLEKPGSESNSHQMEVPTHRTEEEETESFHVESFDEDVDIACLNDMQSLNNVHGMNAELKALSDSETTEQQTEIIKDKGTITQAQAPVKSILKTRKKVTFSSKVEIHEVELYLGTPWRNVKDLNTSEGRTEDEGGKINPNLDLDYGNDSNCMDGSSLDSALNVDITEEIKCDSCKLSEDAQINLNGSLSPIISPKIGETERVMSETNITVKTSSRAEKSNNDAGNDIQRQEAPSDNMTENPEIQQRENTRRKGIQQIKTHASTQGVPFSDSLGGNGEIPNEPLSKSRKRSRKISDFDVIEEKLTEVFGRSESHQNIQVENSFMQRGEMFNQMETYDVSSEKTPQNVDESEVSTSEHCARTQVGNMPHGFDPPPVEQDREQCLDKAGQVSIEHTQKSKEQHGQTGTETMPHDSIGNKPQIEEMFGDENNSTSSCSKLRAPVAVHREVSSSREINAINSTEQTVNDTQPFNITYPKEDSRVVDRNVDIKSSVKTNQDQENKETDTERRKQKGSSIDSRNGPGRKTSSKKRRKAKRGGRNSEFMIQNPEAMTTSNQDASTPNHETPSRWQNQEFSQCQITPVIVNTNLLSLPDECELYHAIKVPASLLNQSIGSDDSEKIYQISLSWAPNLDEKQNSPSQTSINLTKVTTVPVEFPGITTQREGGSLSNIRDDPLLLLTVDNNRIGVCSTDAFPNSTTQKKERPTSGSLVGHFPDTCKQSEQTDTCLNKTLREGDFIVMSNSEDETLLIDKDSASKAEADVGSTLSETSEQLGGNETAVHTKQKRKRKKQKKQQLLSQQLCEHVEQNCSEGSSESHSLRPVERSVTPELSTPLTLSSSSVKLHGIPDYPNHNSKLSSEEAANEMPTQKKEQEQNKDSTVKKNPKSRKAKFKEKSRTQQADLLGTNQTAGHLSDQKTEDKDHEEIHCRGPLSDFVAEQTSKCEQQGTKTQKIEAISQPHAGTNHLPADLEDTLDSGDSSNTAQAFGTGPIISTNTCGHTALTVCNSVLAIEYNNSLDTAPNHNVTDSFDIPGGNSQPDDDITPFGNLTSSSNVQPVSENSEMNDKPKKKRKKKRKSNKVDNQEKTVASQDDVSKACSIESNSTSKSNVVETSVEKKVNEKTPASRNSHTGPVSENVDVSEEFDSEFELKHTDLTGSFLANVMRRVEVYISRKTNGIIERNIMNKAASISPLNNTEPSSRLRFRFDPERVKVSLEILSDSDVDDKDVDYDSPDKYDFDFAKLGDSDWTSTDDSDDNDVGKSKSTTKRSKQPPTNNKSKKGEARHFRIKDVRNRRSMQSITYNSDHSHCLQCQKNIRRSGIFCPQCRVAGYCSHRCYRLHQPRHQDRCCSSGCSLQPRRALGVYIETAGYNGATFFAEVKDQSGNRVICIFPCNHYMKPQETIENQVRSRNIVELEPVSNVVRPGDYMIIFDAVLHMSHGTPFLFVDKANGMYVIHMF